MNHICLRCHGKFKAVLSTNVSKTTLFFSVPPKCLAHLKKYLIWITFFWSAQFCRYKSNDQTPTQQSITYTEVQAYLRKYSYFYILCHLVFQPTNAQWVGGRARRRRTDTLVSVQIFLACERGCCAPVVLVERNWVTQKPRSSIISL